jgi:hypothetical protein
MAETADALRLRRELALTQEAEAKAAAAKAAAKPAAGKPWTHAGNGAVNPATPGGAGSAAGLVMLAGAIAFFGNMKVDKGFPKAGARIITATILLAIILSLFDNGKLSPIARGIGYLMVLSALVRYVPKFSTKGK